MTDLPDPSKLEHAWEEILKRDEKRTSARHVAVVRTTWLAWYEEDEFHSTDGVLQDISRGGAALEVGKAPPCTDIWFCLEAAGRVWGAPFVVVDTTKGQSMAYRMRGRFPDGCPEELYRVALRGYRSARARTPHAQSAGQRLWRRLKERVLGQPDRPEANAEGPEPGSVLLRPLVLGLFAEGATEVSFSTLTEDTGPGPRQSGDAGPSSRFVIPPATAPFPKAELRPPV
jgi:hypothetical protein